ncbi:alpha/beta fold hydrolase [Jatrophihabitans sp.]|uniref:alpha/beta fold hydrolase n=1 Tax=Jatrophihabitans sp. TaxID=1932789 RepID=UPI0030C6CF26|nr:alpha/beta hydrolase fold protein [Jatrophihabitans sp.]
MTTAPTPNLSRVDLPQGTVTYRVAGPSDSTRPPVVFVHGLLVDSLLWTSVAELLAEQGIRSYAPNWPMGSHRVPMNPDADLSPRGMARVVLDFLAALALTDVTLVGNDTGGAICQFVLDTDQSRIGRLVLTNCDAFDVFPPTAFVPLVKVGAHAKLIKPLIGATRPTYLRHSRLGFGLLFAGKPDAAVTRSWIEPCLTDKAIRRDAAKLMGAIRPKELLDVSTRLGSFTKPVQLVWGDADRCFKIGFAERLASVFPNATVTPVAGGKTFVSLEFPDQVAAAISAAADAG